MISVSPTQDSRKALYASLALILVALALASSAISWGLYLIAPLVFYRLFPAVVTLLWQYAPVAAILATVLVGKSLPNRLAKLSRIGIVLLALILPATWIHWYLCLPVRHALQACDGFMLIDQRTNTALEPLVDTRPIAAILHSDNYVEAPKPNEPPDYDLAVSLSQEDHLYRTVFLGFPVDIGPYYLVYYSKQSVIGDPRTNEFVYAPPKFRQWIQSHK